LIRFSDEELKHQELFRRIETMMANGMPEGYKFLPDPDEVAAAVLQNSTWAVLALILEIELFTQEHYKQSIEPEENLSELYKDIFLFHWKEETTHAMMDELEWPREDSKPLMWTILGKSVIVHSLMMKLRASKMGFSERIAGSTSSLGSSIPVSRSSLSI
jgi:hypothetical protein